MSRRSLLVTALLLSVWICPAALAEAQTRAGGEGRSDRYWALPCPAPAQGSTWAILRRDGANRPVAPYLSSLGQGESGVGVISSQPFVISSDRIEFTICGHDGRNGGRAQNFIALVDARKGRTLARQFAPGNDALQERHWDTREFRGVEARIEVHDGNRGTAFAWLGIGRIDAGRSLRVDFRRGMPEQWSQTQSVADQQVRYEVVAGGIPFRRDPSTYSVIPQSGSLEIPCGFAAERLFFLGCTISDGRPAGTYGGIEIHYPNGACDLVPLMVGFTLDRQYKLPSPSPALHLHASADPYQYYLAVSPRKEVIEKLRLVANPERGPIPRITAITCETTGQSDVLVPLPDTAPAPPEVAWIAQHTIAPGKIRWEEVYRDIYQAHRRSNPLAQQHGVGFRKHVLDRQFRSEGVAVGDFNGDGRADITTGNVYYAAPDWRPRFMRQPPRVFPRLGYSDAFLCFADDVDQDQATDVVVVGFPGRQTRWLRNPDDPAGPWREYLAVETTGNESPHYADVDADGQRELVFIEGRRLAIARPGRDATQPWAVTHLGGPDDPSPAHGLGVGDVDGDGHVDILVPTGWWRNPGVPDRLPWPFRPAALFGEAQLCVGDLDGDGDRDVLGSRAHGYGIAWSEQMPDGWRQHAIDSDTSQTHALQLADINGDGLLDFVTGKRFWAHNGRDPGSFEPAVLVWYEQRRAGNQVRWSRHTIDVDSGVGLQVQVVDVNGDQLPDIVTSGKKGVHYFEQTRTGDRQ